MLNYTYLGIQEYSRLTTPPLLSAEAEYLSLFHASCIEKFKRSAPLLLN